jgi:hypothetical protein
MRAYGFKMERAPQSTAALHARDRACLGVHGASLQAVDKDSDARPTDCKL